MIMAMTMTMAGLSPTARAPCTGMAHTVSASEEHRPFEPDLLTGAHGSAHRMYGDAKTCDLDPGSRQDIPDSRLFLYGKREISVPRVVARQKVLLPFAR